MNLYDLIELGEAYAALGPAGQSQLKGALAGGPLNECEMGDLRHVADFLRASRRLGIEAYVEATAIELYLQRRMTVRKPTWTRAQLNLYAQNGFIDGGYWPTRPIHRLVRMPMRVVRARGDCLN